MSKTTAPAKKTAKKEPSLRTLRRRFLAEQKTVNLDPLRPDEYTELHAKMERLQESNHELLIASLGVDQCRTDLIETELALQEAEDHLRGVKEEHQTAMREIAPLLNRLPSVA